VVFSRFQVFLKTLEPETVKPKKTYFASNARGTLLDALWYQGAIIYRCTELELDVAKPRG